MEEATSNIGAETKAWLLTGWQHEVWPATTTVGITEAMHVHDPAIIDRYRSVIPDSDIIVLPGTVA